MKTARISLLGLLLFLNGMPVTVFAQAVPQVFALPDAVAGEPYRVNVETVLRETYHLKLESNARTAIYRWSAMQGELPAGLFIRSNGSMAGMPRTPRAEPYRFQLRVLDISSPHGEPLTLDFTMMISAPRVRLAHINTPRLVATSDERAELKSQMAAPADDDQNKVSSRSDETESTGNSSARRWTAESIYTSMLRNNTVPDSATTDATSSGPPAPAATTVDCTGLCDAPAPSKGTKDFIIDAVTGATSGESKLKRTDRARIIIKNKNPFLYEYRLTIEEKTVEEPALASLGDLLGPVGKGTFDEAEKAKDKADKAAQAIKEKQKQDEKNDIRPTLAESECHSDVLRLIARNKTLAASESSLVVVLIGDDNHEGLTDKFTKIQDQAKPLKAALTTPGAQCPGLCSDANTLLGLLRGYLSGSKAPVEDFTKVLASFERQANSFSDAVASSKEDNPECAKEIDDASLPQLAEHYLETAKKLKAGLEDLSNGRKAFDTSAKSIEKVFATAGAFYEVRETGDFDLPTNVNIKLERKEIAAEKGEFGKVAETKINFGGGPRFTLGGGLVASLLERPEYQRVSTVVNGQVVNIVGLKRTSSSRVLPLLMLHTRLWDFRKGAIDGLHFSVGLTAKPNSEGTSAEFLIGPSLSFAQGRMFFTAGGYMGKKQELQGSFTVGSQIPKDFGDDLPVSDHYVWKPGFAITYKIK